MMTLAAPALRSYEFWLAQYLRSYRGSIWTSFVNPVVELAALGLGLGYLVDRGGLFPARYLDFLAPGLLAVTALQVAASEGMWGVLGGLRWHRTYYAMRAAPLSSGDILAGHQLWIATRVFVAGAILLGVTAAFGGLRSPLAPLAVPVAVLVGLATSAPFAAFVSHVAHERFFSPIFAYVLGPMIFLSGTFFPVSALPGFLHPVAAALPLTHGVDLCRSLTLGPFRPEAAALDVAVLLAWTAAAMIVARVTYRRRLG